MSTNSLKILQRDLAFGIIIYLENIREFDVGQGNVREVSGWFGSFTVI